MEEMKGKEIQCKEKKRNEKEGNEQIGEERKREESNEKGSNPVERELEVSPIFFPTPFGRRSCYTHPE